MILNFVFSFRDISHFLCRRNSIFKSFSRSCDAAGDGGEGGEARAQSPFIDVEALSDEDADIPAAGDLPPDRAVEAEPVKRDLKEEVEVSTYL